MNYLFCVLNSFPGDWSLGYGIFQDEFADDIFSRLKSTSSEYSENFRSGHVIDYISEGASI